MDSVPLERAVQQLAWLLFAAALLAMLAHRLRVPYAVALVLGGLLIEESHLAAVPRLEPAVLLFVFLPPLLFDAAFRLDGTTVARVAPGILWLAVPGVLLTALIVGAILFLALHLPLATALLFGSIVSATDPVAVVAVFRRLAVPEHLATVAEGESLVNDGMAITLYTALLGLTATGSLDVVRIAKLFGWEVALGIVVGLGSGWLFSRLSAAVDDHLVEMTLSTALAFGSYLIAQALHASGPLACVTAGLLHGTYGRAVAMSGATARLLDDLWEYLGFAANVLVFLLLGLSVNLSGLLAQGGAVFVAIVAVVLSRVLVVAAAAAIPHRGLDVSWGEAAVLVWGGLRGALTAALALALPIETPGREVVVAMAFGVVLFTLVAQGLSLPWVIRRVGLGHEGHRAPRG